MEHQTPAKAIMQKSRGFNGYMSAFRWGQRMYSMSYNNKQQAPEKENAVGVNVTSPEHFSY